MSGPIETLDLHLGRGPLPLAKALRYGIDLAESLRQVHERGRVCAFLQPACVTIANGRAGLGSAKPTNLSPYFSPEQVRGKDLDPRSDLFSLGAILYEMLSGHRAFPGQSKSALRLEILERHPERLENVPPAVAQLVAHCLEKKPEQRLQRVDVLLAGLKLQHILMGSAKPRARAAAGAAAASPAERELLPMPPLTPIAAEQFFGEPPMPDPDAEPAAFTGMLCPRCASTDVHDSRPKDRLERTLMRFGVGIRRCHRCFYRFLYKFGMTIGRQGIVDD